MSVWFLLKSSVTKSIDMFFRELSHNVYSMPVRRQRYDKQSTDRKISTELWLVSASTFKPGILTCLFVTIMSTVSSQVIQGSIARCIKEGEEVFIPGISTDPCITCLCSMKEIICRQRKCPIIDGCHVIPYDKPVSHCCQKCKGCTQKGQAYMSDSHWIDSRDPCRVSFCQAGVVTSFIRRCEVICRNPLLLPGQCCPVCEGCKLNGTVHTEGETFKYTNDPCISCQCLNSSVTCQRVICPVLNCPDTQQILPLGSCCARCEGRRQVYLPPAGACLFKLQVYPDNSTLDIDRCTSCVCVGGTLLCERISCPILDCATTNTVTGPTSCCPRCLHNKRKCKLYGQRYMHGEVWKQDMCTHCMCHDGTVRCHVESCTNRLDCPNNTKLKMQPDQCCPQCVDDGALCTVFGDPHYRTFDGRIYNFQGTCDYVLTRTCDSSADLSVIVRNDARLTEHFAWTKSVRLHIGGAKIYLLQKNRIKVNKKRVRLPYVHRQGQFSIVSVGRSVALKTISGAKITWDGDNYLEVYVPASLKHNMCGLCGNYNNDKSDDLLGADGILHLDPEEFGNSWIAAGKRCKSSSMNHVKQRNSPCFHNPDKQRRAEIECAHIFNPHFEECQMNEDVHSYYSSCLTDVCECPENKNCFCESMLAYTRACAQEGFNLHQYLPLACKALNCPKGSHWSECACPKTCDTVYNDTSCPEPCVGGCDCPKDRVLHNNRCTKPTKCHHVSPVHIKDNRRRKNSRPKKKHKKLPFEYLIES